MKTLNDVSVKFSPNRQERYILHLTPEAKNQIKDITTGILKQVKDTVPHDTDYMDRNTLVQAIKQINHALERAESQVHGL